MRNIFIGFIFIFLDFSLNLGNSKIGLIPDFIGFIIIVRGLEEMAVESPLFMKVKPFVSGMSVYTGILYLLDLLGISVSLGVLTYVLAFTSTVVSLYISYGIVMAVIDIEGKHNRSLNGDSLKSTWTLLAILNILTFITLLIPALAMIFMIVSFVVAICFLSALNKSKNLYYD